MSKNNTSKNNWVIIMDCWATGDEAYLGWYGEEYATKKDALRNASYIRGSAGETSKKFEQGAYIFGGNILVCRKDWAANDERWAYVVKGT